MHIPVLLAGFLCGPWWAAAVGFIAPPLRYILFGRPPIFSTGLAMCFELAVYGAVTGSLWRRGAHKVPGIYCALLCAMAVGRAIWGIASVILYSATEKPFTWTAFIAGRFINAVPGIICHIIIIPPIVALHHATGVVSRIGHVDKKKSGMRAPALIPDFQYT